MAEYYGLTQLTGVSVMINAQGADLPTPEVLARRPPSDEQWEGVLVQVTGDVAQKVSATARRGRHVGECRIDDRGYDAIGTGNVTQEAPGR